MRVGWTTWAAISLLVALVAAGDWRAPVAAQPKDNARALIKRGEYLVNEVALCGSCHTPRTAKGKPDLSRHLQGARLSIKPAKPGEDWEDKAPDITASGKGGKWNEKKMIKYLSTGGKSDPPMPAYHLAVDDARAVTAYLRSLPGKKKAGGRKDDDDD